VFLDPYRIQSTRMRDAHRLRQLLLKLCPAHALSAAEIRLRRRMSCFSRWRAAMRAHPLARCSLLAVADAETRSASR
jgi:hypothetical protein